MPMLPSVTPFAQILVDTTNDLRRGCSTLITVDKGWNQLLFLDIQNRLRKYNVECDLVDGRPARGTNQPDDMGVMLCAIAHLRRIVRRRSESPLVVALPHLDVLVTSEGGWNNISREVVPLLFENPLLVVLGFRDPSITLLPVVEKLFTRGYSIYDNFALIPDELTEPVEEPPPQIPVEPPVQETPITETNASPPYDSAEDEEATDEW